MNQLKISFIGGGNMAEGIIQGMVDDDRFDPQQIYVFDIIPERISFLHEKYGVSGAETMQAAVENSDVLVFAVRPQDAQLVSLQVKKFMLKETIFVSICAGVTMNSFEEFLGGESKIVRVMPNTLTRARHGFSSVCNNVNVSTDELKPVVAMLEAIGQVMFVKESMFDVFTAYSCTGPAYLLYLMSSMINAGVRAGFARKDARAITIENMIGTALKLEQTGLHPYEILDTMTSPAGVGIEGIYTMEKEGLSGALMHSIEEATKRAQELA